MSTTPLEFPLLRVLLRNILVHGISSLLIVHVPPFIHSCITLSFQVQIQNRLLHSDLKTKAIIQNYFKTLLQYQALQTPSRTESNTCCLSTRSLVPSPIKVNIHNGLSLHLSKVLNGQYLNTSDLSIQRRGGMLTLVHVEWCVV